MFNADGDMLTQFHTGSSYGRFLENNLLCQWRHADTISFWKFIWMLLLNK